MVAFFEVYRLSGFVRTVEVGGGVSRGIGAAVVRFALGLGPKCVRSVPAGQAACPAGAWQHRASAKKARAEYSSGPSVPAVPAGRAMYQMS